MKMNFSLLSSTMLFGLVIVVCIINTNVVYCYTMEGSGDWWYGEYSCLMNRGTHLATIYTSGDLINFCDLCNNKSCWIGLNNYYSGDSEWFWLSRGSYDDSQLEITSFYRLTGLNVSLDRKSCIFYNGESNTFEFGDCDDKSLNYYFVCDDDYGDKARQRFVTLPYKTNWFNGQKFCANKYGSNLANIMNSSENLYIWSLSQLNLNLNSSDTATYWIGLYNFMYDSDEASLFRWTDFYVENFVDSGYRNWNTSIFDGNDMKLTYDCVYYDSLSLTWLSDDCGNNNEHFIICDNPFIYDYNNSYYSQRYVIAPSITDSSLQSFFESRMSCLLFFNTHLASITNSGDNELMIDSFSNDDIFMNNFYFGYFDDGQVEGEFRWDNSHINSIYTNWNTGEPNDTTGDKDCSVMRSDGTWDNVNCESNRYSVCDNGHFLNNYLETNVSYVSIHACDNWNELITFELRNTMHIVIKDTSGTSTDYISINVNGGLPNPGYWKTYEINDTQLSSMGNNNNEKIYSISIGMSSNDIIYCIDGFFGVINGESYVLNEQLKNGVILSENCENNFYYDYENKLYRYCNQGLYSMYTNYGSRIINNMYQLSLQTCSINGADVNFNNVDVSISIIGKDLDSNTWVSSNSVLLNHVSTTGNIEWSNVGTLISTSLYLYSDGSKEILSIDHEGTLIGIKIVVSNEDSHYGDVNFWSFDTWQFSVDNCGTSSTCESGSRVSMFNSQNVYVTGSDSNVWIVVRPNIGQSRVDDSDYSLSIDNYIQFYFSNVINAENDIGNNGYVIVHIYGIFEEELDNYYLPYQFVDSNKTIGFTWSESDEYCMNNYGTHLASIHSDDEMLAVLLVKKGSQSWIGLTDRYSEGSSNGNIFEWNDYSSLNYQHWNDGEPNSYGGFEEDCVNIYNNGWNDARCSLSRNWLYFICGKSVWNSNVKKTFNIPIESTFSSNEVVMVSITNDDYDGICIDSVSVNDIFAQSIPNRWIGDSSSSSSSSSSNSNDCVNNDCVSTTYVIMKWPVCTIEIIETTLLWDDMDYDEADSSISGLTCTNFNRLHSSTCQVSQSFTFETYTDIEFSESQTFSTSSSVSETKGESIATESSTTIGDTFSHTESTSVNIGRSHEIGSSVTVGAEFEAGVIFSKAKTSIETTLSYAHGWNEDETNTDSETTSSIFEETRSTISERYSDVTRQHSTSSSTSKTDTMTVGTSTSNTIECVASMDVQASTSIDYYFTFSRTQAIIPTLTDLKLTMCNYYLTQSSDNIDSSNSVMYIYDIEGEIAVDVVSNCDVSFNAPRILHNEMTCYQELQLSFLSHAPFVPVCNETHAQFYDGCQCTGLNENSSPRMCMCVDIYGTPLETSDGILHNNDDDWKDTCRLLNCPNSRYQTATSAASAASQSISNSNKIKFDSQTIIIIILSNSLVIAFCCICLILVYMFKLKQKYTSGKEKENIAQTIIDDDQKKTANVEMGTEIDIVMN